MGKVIVDTDTGEIISEVGKKYIRYRKWASFNMEPVYADKRRALMIKSGVAAAVFDFMIGHVNSHGTCKLSYTEIENKLKISRSAVQRAVRILKDEEMITVEPKGRDNVYRINGNIAWAAYGKPGRHAKDKIIRLDLKRDEALEN